MTPHVVAAVFARGGSKGVPRKNIRPLAGKPLIAYAIETGLASRWARRVVVSTDDTEIADVARAYGADVPFMRPAELATDDAPEWLAWQHLIRTLRAAGDSIDVLLALPTTSPLRTVEDVDACVSRLLETDADIVVTAKAAERNPYFNMVTLDAEHNARLVIEPRQTVHRRQAAPVVYDMTTVAYAARAPFVMRAQSTFDGKVKAVLVPTERALDIDSEFDFRLAEYLMRETLAREPV